MLLYIDRNEVLQNYLSNNKERKIGIYHKLLVGGHVQQMCCFHLYLVEKLFSYI